VRSVAVCLAGFGAALRALMPWDLQTYGVVIVKFHLQLVSVAVLGVAVSLGGCGGGSGDASPSPVTGSPSTPTPTPVTANGTAALVSPAANTKFQWEAATPITVSLLDANNAAVSGPLTCAAAIAGTVAVAADCTSLTAKRIGAQTIVVSSGATTASFVIQAIPQRQPIAARSVASGGMTFSVAPAAGTPWFWGDNHNAKLAQLVGYTTLLESGLPLAAKLAASTPMTNIVSTATGDSNAMALTEEGEIWSWGRTAFNLLGFVSSDPNEAAIPGKVRNAANLANLNHIVQVNVAEMNAAALADDGSVYAWGGSLTVGQGPTATGKFANKVQTSAGVFLSDIVQISVGHNVTLALSRNGTVYAWGLDNWLNTGTSTSNGGKQVAYATPVVAAGTLAPLSGIVSVSAGYSTGMALTATGNVYVWGANNFGQLGQGTQSASGVGSLAVLAKAPATQSGNLSNIKAISAGGLHQMALTATGEVLAWGFTPNGAIGEGNTVNLGNQATLPNFVIDTSGTGNLTGIKAIAAGYSNSLALMSTGEVLIWGRNDGSSLAQNQTVSALFLSRIPLKGGISQPVPAIPLTLHHRHGTLSPSHLARCCLMRRNLGRPVYISTCRRQLHRRKVFQKIRHSGGIRIPNRLRQLGRLRPGLTGGAFASDDPAIGLL
jgi:alpha-tubulin suppressor-like RCC1 family protein